MHRPRVVALTGRVLEANRWGWCWPRGRRNGLEPQHSTAIGEETNLMGAISIHRPGVTRWAGDAQPAMVQMPVMGTTQADEVAGVGGAAA